MARKYEHIALFVVLLVFMLYLAGCECPGPSRPVQTVWDSGSELTGVDPGNQEIVIKLSVPTSPSQKEYKHTFAVSTNPADLIYANSKEATTIEKNVEFQVVDDFNSNPLQNGTIYHFKVWIENLETGEIDDSNPPGFGKPAFEWDYGHAATNEPGYAYGAGSFESGIDFDIPGASPYESAGGRDAYVFKYDWDPVTKTGEVLWACAWGGALLDECNAVTHDSSGNVYVTGHFQGSISFQCPNSPTKPFLSSGLQDGFICKLNNNGDMEWAHDFGGTGIYDEGRAIVCDSDEAVYVAGIFENTIEFPDTGDPPDPITLTSEGSTDVFIAKFDKSDGNCVWAQKWGSGFDDLTSAMITREEGSDDFVYVTGTHKPGLRSTHRAFLLKYKEDGNVADGYWPQILDPIGIWDEGEALEFAKSPSTDIYLVGYSYPGHQGPPVEKYKVFAAKFPYNGHSGSPVPPSGSLAIGILGIWDEGEALAIDNLGNVFATGFFAGGRTEVLRKYQPTWGAPQNDWGTPLWEEKCDFVDFLGIWDEGEALVIRGSLVYITGRSEHNHVYEGTYFDIYDDSSSGNCENHEEFPP